MRFTISREKLQEGLTAVTASVPAKTMVIALKPKIPRAILPDTPPTGADSS